MSLLEELKECYQKLDSLDYTSDGNAKNILTKYYYRRINEIQDTRIQKLEAMIIKLEEKIDGLESKHKTSDSKSEDDDTSSDN